MEVEVRTQDVFKSQTQLVGPASSPTKGVLLLDWKCEQATTQGFLCWDEQSSSLGSHCLPSLGISDRLPDIVEIGFSRIAYSNFLTKDGIDELTSLAMKYFFIVKDGGSSHVAKEFIHVVTVLEHLGICGALSEEVLLHLDRSLHRLVKKVSTLLGHIFLWKTAIRCPALHVFVFTLKVAFTVYNSTREASEITRERRNTLLTDVLYISSVGMVRIHERFESVAPCSCVQAFLFLLFRDSHKRFESVFIDVFEKEHKGNPVRKDLMRGERPLPMAFFAFFIEVANYLLDLNRIKSGSEFTTKFLGRILAMVRSLALTHTVHVCELLSRFLQKNELSGMDKMTTRILWREVMKHLEQDPIDSLEDAARGSPEVWAELILKDFETGEDDVTNKRIHMIKIWKLIFRDRAVFDFMRSFVKGTFTDAKLGLNSNAIGAFLSLLLHLLTNKEIASNLCENDLEAWLLTIAKQGDPTVLKRTMNANRVAKITLDQEISYDEKAVGEKLINAIPLPKETELFVQSVLELSPYEELKTLDLKRATTLSDMRFKHILDHFREANWTLPSEVWTKAKSLVEKGDQRRVKFVHNQLFLGVSKNQPFFVQQKKDLLKKYKEARALRADVLDFLKEWLSSSFAIKSEDYVPLWIKCVVSFSHCCELETRALCEAVWDRIRRELPPEADVSMFSQAQPLDYVVKLMEVLPPNCKPTQQKLCAWFPYSLGTSLQSFIKEPIPEKRRLSLQVFCALLGTHGDSLMTIAIENEAKETFNKSMLVTVICAVTDKKVIHDRAVEERIHSIVSRLASIPKNKKSVFIGARLKDFLVEYAREPVGPSLVTVVKEKGEHYLELLKKDPLIGEMCRNLGF